MEMEMVAMVSGRATKTYGLRSALVWTKRERARDPLVRFRRNRTGGPFGRRSIDRGSKAMEVDTCGVKLEYAAPCSALENHSLIR